MTDFVVPQAHSQRSQEDSRLEYNIAVNCHVIQTNQPSLSDSATNISRSTPERADDDGLAGSISQNNSQLLIS